MKHFTNHVMFKYDINVRLESQIVIFVEKSILCAQKIRNLRKVYFKTKYTSFETKYTNYRHFIVLDHYVQ